MFSKYEPSAKHVPLSTEKTFLPDNNNGTSGVSRQSQKYLEPHLLLHVLTVRPL